MMSYIDRHAKAGMYMIREIQRITITDAVVENIKEMIESGGYEIGQKLPTESDFCNAFKVSRTSVREAFRVLQALGYVEIRPGKGAFVADYLQATKTANWYDVENAKFNDFMEVRMAVETLSVRLSVERATAKEVLELETIHKTFIEACDTHDQVKLIMLDELFHNKIIEMTNNQLLINIHKEVLTCFRKYRSNSFRDPKTYFHAIEPHARVLGCFKEKDAARSVVEMRKHLEITALDMESLLTKHGAGQGEAE